MAIDNLSGNFQPLRAESGTNLPPATSGAPSTQSAKVENNVENRLSVVPSNQPLSQSINNAEINAENDKEAVESQIEELQNFNQNIDRSLQFKVDEELGVTIVRVIDKQTDELIRQFPPEELINLSRRLKELNEENSGNSGVLLQEKV